MFNLLLKNALKRAAYKLATDKSARTKVQQGIYKAKELNSKGELLKSLGRAAGRLKRKIKEQ